MNGTGEFLKHKFDMMVMFGLVGLLVVVLFHVGYYHDQNLTIAIVALLGNAIGAVINMATNRATGHERSTDPEPAPPSEKAS